MDGLFNDKRSNTAHAKIKSKGLPRVLNYFNKAGRESEYVERNESMVVGK